MPYFSTFALFNTLLCPHSMFSNLFLLYIYILFMYNLIFSLFFHRLFIIHSLSFFHLFFILSILSFPCPLTFLYFNASSLPTGGCQSSLCTPYDITQCRLRPVHATVRALVALDISSSYRKQNKPTPSPSPASCRAARTPSVVSVTTQTSPPAWHIWDILGYSLVHVLCLVLLFVAYSWSELT